MTETSHDCARWRALILAALCWATPLLAETRLVILGTGNPNPDPERSGPGLGVVVDEQAYIVDFGPGIVRRAAAAAERHGIEALELPALDTALATHLHSDHTIGLPDLLLSPWVLGREVPLRVFGPAGLKHMARHVHEAYREDISMRLYGLEPANPRGHQIEAFEIEAGVILEESGVRITAFPVLHGSWPEAYGYRFDTPDRSIVISGDARPSPELLEAARGVDVLVHEVYSVEGFRSRPPEWQTYHASFHTSTAELARIARETRPGLLVLYHQLYWGSSDDDLLREIREAGYEGPVVSASDLDVY